MDHPAGWRVALGAAKGGPTAMPSYDFRAPRLYVDATLDPDAAVALAPPQSHYLLNVLRRRPGETVLVFNGREGEWLARVEVAGRKAARVTPLEQTRAQPAPTDLHYLFAPLKHARLDYLVQKAVEMGASRLQPVITRHTQTTRVNLDRMRANAVEATEQCGILALPEIAGPLALAELVAGFAPERLLVFCDEAADVTDPVAALAAARPRDGSAPAIAVLTGPEGGFAPDERAALLALPRVVRLALGPRILRADTAAVAALALMQAVLGDWR
jgi:16S rRNA (uracil1498-N3)-methyltransferase